MEYLAIPNVADSKFLVLESMFMIFPSHIVMILMVKRYPDYKIDEKIMRVKSD